VVPARGARTVAPAGVGKGGATERGWGGERQSVSIFTPTITRREEKRDPLSLATTLRAERSVLGFELDIRLSTGEWARQLGGGRGRGGGGGCSAPTWRACRRGLGGTTPRPHCRRHPADTVEGAVSARLRTTSADSPCSLGRSARLTVRCSSALKCIRALAWSRLQDEAVRNRCAEVVDSSAALRSGSPQTSGRWSIPVGRAPDVVSGKSSHSLALARSAGGHGRKGTTYPTSSSSSVCVCLLPRRGASDPDWLVCAGPPAAACRCNGDGYAPTQHLQRELFGRAAGEIFFGLSYSI